MEAAGWIWKQHEAAGRGCKEYGAVEMRLKQMDLQAACSGNAFARSRKQHDGHGSDRKQRDGLGSSR